MQERHTEQDYRALLIADTPIIDVRAPIEFEHGAMPAAINLPLMNNDERAAVGTCYKQQGSDAALALGHKLVAGEIRQQRMDAWRAACLQNPQGILCCARGGQRSHIVQSWLHAAGIDYPLVEGGYKALRQTAIQATIELAQKPIVLIGGCTGSGKTLLVQQQPNGVDLEGLARHRGSAFGRTLQPQLSQASFENLLAAEMLKTDARQNLRLWVLEDESRMIGSNHLPECLREAGVQPPRGQVWNAGDIRTALHTLRQMGLTDDKDRVVAEFEHDLCIEGLQRMAPAVRKVLERGAGIHTAALRLRLAVYKRDLKAYERARLDAQAMEEGGNHPFAGQFADTPTDPGWLAALPPRMRLDVITNNLIPLVEAGIITRNLRNCLDVLPQLRSSLADLPPCPALILFDALAGRYAEARAQIVPLLLDRTEFRGPLFQGIIAFLEGGDAVPALREAQKRFRKASGKRKALLPGPGGLRAGPDPSRPAGTPRRMRRHTARTVPPPTRL